MPEKNEAPPRRGSLLEADQPGIYKDGTYLENNKTWHAEDSPWKAGRIKAILDRNKLSPARVCEVGCGAGEILKTLSEAMPAGRFDGYEVSPQAYGLCKGKENDRLNFHLGDVAGLDVFYDCLLCIDVMEHVEDYIGFIKGLKGKARYKIFHIPLDISVSSVLLSSMMRARLSVGHLHYFNRDTALATLRDAGYEIVDAFYTAAFKDRGSKARSLKEALARLPRRLLFSVSPDLEATLLGGSSLMVLAR